jgi:hypothetical protein
VQCRFQIKRRCQCIKKEFSIAVLEDLFYGFSFLRFLAQKWRRWGSGAHWRRCATPSLKNFAGKLDTTRKYDELTRKLKLVNSDRERFNYYALGYSYRKSGGIAY